MSWTTYTVRDGEGPRWPGRKIPVPENLIKEIEEVVGFVAAGIFELGGEHGTTILGMLEPPDVKWSAEYLAGLWDLVELLSQCRR